MPPSRKTVKRRWTKVARVVKAAAKPMFAKRRQAKLNLLHNKGAGMAYVQAGNHPMFTRFGLARTRDKFLPNSMYKNTAYQPYSTLSKAERSKALQRAEVAKANRLNLARKMQNVYRKTKYKMRKAGDTSFRGRQQRMRGLRKFRKNFYS